VKKMPLRKGKKLVLPEVVYALQADGTFAEEVDYRARINRDLRFGRLGRVMVLRYNPRVGSSNPVVQVLLRCNLDLQCTDRVYVLLDESEQIELDSQREPDDAPAAGGVDSAEMAAAVGTEGPSTGSAADASHSGDGDVPSKVLGAGPFDEEVDPFDDPFFEQNLLDLSREDMDEEDPWSEGAEPFNDAEADDGSDESEEMEEMPPALKSA